MTRRTEEKINPWEILPYEPKYDNKTFGDRLNERRNTEVKNEFLLQGIKLIKPTNIKKLIRK